MLFVLKLIALAYLMSLVIIYVVARSAIGDRAYRMVFCVIGAALPVMFVAAVVRGMFRSSSPISYSPEIASVEDAIEAERVRLFGGEPLRPSISEHWQRKCQVEMQVMALRADKATQRLKHFKAHWGVGRA